MEEELTLKEFVAYMFYTLEHQGSEMLPLWLCLRKDLQEKSLKKVDTLFKEWMQHELEARKSRERSNKACTGRFATRGVQVQRTSTGVWICPHGVPETMACRLCGD